METRGIGRRRAAAGVSIGSGNATERGGRMVQHNKAQDPLEAAMSAIEDALNLAHDDQVVGDKAKAAPAPAISPPSAGKPLPNVSLDQKLPAPAVEKPSAPAAPAPILKPAASEAGDSKPILAPSSAPANDDRPSVGQILQAMQTRPPSRVPFVFAFVASLIWLVLCGVFFASHFTAGDFSAMSTRDFWLRPEIGLAGLSAIGPALFLFALAVLARRAHELRASARSMTQVAMRLAEPEALATDQVVTLSQAIRREVASMGDGIERALARASELENLVRSEVSTLERSYSENERRIRSLIAEMADQREAIVANGGRVRAAIAGAHQGIAADLEGISDRLSERIASAGQRVSSSLGASSEEIVITLERTGNAIAERISGQAGQMHDNLTTIGADISARLAGIGEQAASDLLGRIGGIDQQLRTTGEALVSDLSIR